MNLLPNYFHIEEAVSNDQSCVQIDYFFLVDMNPDSIQQLRNLRMMKWNQHRRRGGRTESGNSAAQACASIRQFQS